MSANCVCMCVWYVWRMTIDQWPIEIWSQCYFISLSFFLHKMRNHKSSERVWTELVGGVGAQAGSRWREAEPDLTHLPNTSPPTPSSPPPPTPSSPPPPPLPVVVCQWKCMAWHAFFNRWHLTVATWWHWWQKTRNLQESTLPEPDSASLSSCWPAIICV